MKSFLSIIGMLTLAQWLFILLLHVFLSVQDKRSPETLNRLHELPVVGGYFPAVKIETADDVEKKKQIAQLERLHLAKEYYQLPDAFSPEELQGLINEIRGQKGDLARQRQEIEDKKSELDLLVQDLERREKEFVQQSEKLEERATELKKAEREVAARSSVTDEAYDEIETTNLKRIAGYLNGVEPGKTATLLVPPTLHLEPESKRKERYREAAKILALMETEVAAQVVAAFDPLDWLRVEAEQKTLPVKSKKG